MTLREHLGRTGYATLFVAVVAACSALGASFSVVTSAARSATVLPAHVTVAR
jgi:Asp/Glu/hydantoin racemase